jgi:hypothetical protein
MQDQPLKTSELVDMVDAQGETIYDVSLRLVKLEELIEKQESRNRGILYAVLFAFIFIVGTVAVDVILFNASDKNEVHSHLELEKNVQEQNFKIKSLKDCLHISTWLNPRCFED